MESSAKNSRKILFTSEGWIISSEDIFECLPYGRYKLSSESRFGVKITT